jgi:hypothetical protein
MTPCTNCPAFGCMKRNSDRIPKACIAKQNSAQNANPVYWGNIKKMELQERTVRASVIDGTWDGGGGSY